MIFLNKRNFQEARRKENLNKIKIFQNNNLNPPHFKELRKPFFLMKFLLHLFRKKRKHHLESFSCFLFEAKFT